MALVITLIYLTGFFYQKLIKVNSKLTNDKISKFDGVNKFTLITGASLGQGKNLHLVEINGKYLVLGSTNSSLNLLKEFSSEEIENLIKEKNG